MRGAGPRPELMRLNLGRTGVASVAHLSTLVRRLATIGLVRNRHTDNGPYLDRVVTKTTHGFLMKEPDQPPALSQATPVTSGVGTQRAPVARVPACNVDLGSDSTDDRPTPLVLARTC